MREERIIIDPFEFISYLEFRSFKAFNNHSMLKIRGVVKKDNAFRYIKMAEQELWIKVILQSGDINRIFFQGVIVELSMEMEGNLYMIEFVAKSGSFLLDIDKHIRSFQSAEIEFRHMTDMCLEKYINSSCIWLEEINENIKDFVMQYEETDWDFIKRICSWKEKVVYPVSHMQGIKFAIGLKKGEIRKLESNNFIVKADSCGYTYIVSDREVYDIGEFVLFNGIEMCVCKVISKMEGNELYHQYHLRKEKQIKIQLMRNKELRGVSIAADVLAVEGDMVKIKILDDENYAKSGSRWFSYATVYSTPDGTGWYCMPEVGDRVRIMFPDNEEKNAYIVSAVHMKNSQARCNPDYKSFMNKQHKEILFTPDAIILRNNKGMEFLMKDGEGITISSDKDITLLAENEICISSNSSNITVEAEEAIALQQGNAKLSLSEGIKMTGGKINMN